MDGTEEIFTQKRKFELTIAETWKVAKASLKGVGVRGLSVSNDRLILGVLNVPFTSILGVLRQSRENDGVDVRVGLEEQGVEVQIGVPPLAVIGLLKNCEGEKGRDFIGVLWGVAPDVEFSEDVVAFNEALLQSSRWKTKVKEGQTIQRRFYNNKLILYYY